MKKIISGIVILASVAACTNANAISEAYRRQLQREHKTQQSEIKAATLDTYADNVIEVQADGKCNVKKVNGFAPVSVSKVIKGTHIRTVKTKMGAEISVEKRDDGSCDLTWTDKDGHSGILAKQ